MIILASVFNIDYFKKEI